MSLRARIWAGVAMLLVGVAVGGGLIVALFIGINDDVGDLHRFGAAADGGAFVVDESQHVWLYLEPQSRSLSGVRYALLDVATGEPVTLQTTGSRRQTYDLPAGSGRSIARIDLEPGEYTVLVEPPDVTIAVGLSPLPGFGDFARAVLYGTPLVLLGGGLALASAIQQTRSRTRQAASTLPPPTSEWTTGSWADTADGSGEVEG